MKLFGRPVDGVFGEDVQHDDDEEQEDAEEEPDVQHLDLGRLGQVLASTGEERIEHQQRRHRHHHAHLCRGQEGQVFFTWEALYYTVLTQIQGQLILLKG